MENLVSLVYSNATCSAYSLTEIDSISANGEPGKSSLPDNLISQDLFFENDTGSQKTNLR